MPTCYMPRAATLAESCDVVLEARPDAGALALFLRYRDTKPSHRVISEHRSDAVIEKLQQGTASSTDNVSLAEEGHAQSQHSTLSRDSMPTRARPPWIWDKQERYLSIRSGGSGLRWQVAWWRWDWLLLCPSRSPEVREIHVMDRMSA